MLASEMVPWILLIGQLGFIMLLPLLSDGMPDYEPRERD